MVFNEILLDLSHVDNNCNSGLTVSTIRFRDLPFKTTHVSSAYKTVESNLETLHRSFIYIMNNRGPSIDP